MRSKKNLLKKETRKTNSKYKMEIAELKEKCKYSSKREDAYMREIGDLVRELRIKDAYLSLMCDLMLDYDGFNSVEGLKGLINEMRDYTKMAIAKDVVTPFFKTSDGKNLNILGEKIV